MSGDFNNPPLLPGEEEFIDDSNPPQRVTVSHYLGALNTRWSFAPRDQLPSIWVAVAGTFCPNRFRQDSPLNRGCTSSYPRNDGIVCEQSANFNGWVLRNGPDLIWDDPSHDYGHTALPVSLFCGLEPARYPLYNPPQKSDLLSAILDLINKLT